MTPSVLLLIKLFKKLSDVTIEIPRTGFQVHKNGKKNIRKSGRGIVLSNNLIAL